MLEKSLLLSGKLIAKLHTLFFKPLFYSLGDRAVVDTSLRFLNLHLIQIGNRSMIHKNCWIQVIDTEKRPVAPVILIGDHVSIGMDSTISAAEKIIIEDHVFTGRSVYISDHQHQYRDITQPSSLQGISKIAPVRIGTETWIGQGAAILPGVTIGRHCVIGANSVVNCDIPDFSIAAGNPARMVRQYNHTTSRWEKTLNE